MANPPFHLHSQKVEIMGRSIIANAAAPQNDAINMAVRQDILANAIPVLQNVRSGSMTYAQGQPTNVNFLASNTGLIRRFFLEISGTLNCAATHTLTATKHGISNLLSNVQYTDQNNRLRINTTGSHLHLLACEKRRRPFGAAFVAGTGITDTCGLGSNFPVQNNPSSVSGGTAQNFTFIWEIPVINSNTDLTGAVYANQTTSNNQLAFTLNPAFFAYNSDPFNAGYTTDAALATTLPTITGLTWTLYQDFLDQLPTDNAGFAVLPQRDISWAVCIQYLNPGPQVQSTDNIYALPPYNVYQNLMLFWDNYGYSGTTGGDVQYVKIQISNTYVLKQWDALLLSALTRNIIGCDLPGANSASAGAYSGGVYSLDLRAKPLSVNQVSSTNIVFRPSNVQGNGSILNIGQEYLWFANQQAA